ncbi:MAG: hypothetical protein LBR15_06390 [Methanobrevibacter sp.]|jgi:hypothetical protein|nr:hypothetical protein [Candidatus Methanovirga australis]
MDPDDLDFLNVINWRLSENIDPNAIENCEIDWTELWTILDGQLETICHTIDKFTTHKEYIKRYLMENGLVLEALLIRFRDFLEPEETENLLKNTIDFYKRLLVFC